MKKLAQATVVAVFVAGLSSSHAQAATFTQVGDTGQTLDTAQVIPEGTLPLDSISGMISGGNVIGLFRFFLTGGQTFSATTVSANTLINLPVDQLLGSPTDLLADPQLFLFDSAGRGVYGNDDSFGSIQATLPSGGFAPTQAGFYFLAIASTGLDPISSLGSIFADTNSDGILDPAGPGAGLPLSGFTGEGTSSWRYEIALTGVTTSDAQSEAVPEPEQMLGVLAAGTLGLMYRLQRWRKRRKAAKFISTLP